MHREDPTAANVQDEVQSVSRQTEWGASKIEANYLRPRIAPATVELGGAPNEPFGLGQRVGRDTDPA